MNIDDLFKTCPICGRKKHICDMYCMNCMEKIKMTAENKPMTNAERLQTGSLLDLAKYGVRGFVPSGCYIPLYYGHFHGYAKSKEEAIQREIDWLQQPAEGAQV